MNKPKNQPDMMDVVCEKYPRKKIVMINDKFVGIPAPTIEEVKQEWEEKGWYILRDTKDYLIFISQKDSCGVHQYDCEIKIFKKCKSYEASMRGGYGLMSYIMTFEIHQLLTKTFRALKWEV